MIAASTIVTRRYIVTRPSSPSMLGRVRAVAVALM